MKCHCEFGKLLVKNMKSKTHKNLPKSDNNERLERLSNQALESILPVEKFLPRKDNPDKGVDSSIEVINENEEFTNFRAQIQLKGTYEQGINKDGSVSFSIETSNIRYLWNNLTSIYVLFIEPRKELRFVWLKDEINRLNKENPNWQDQVEVTIRFSQILNTETVDQIHGQITNEGLLYRKVKDIITTNSESNSRFEIDSTNLGITDQIDAKKILDFYGLELLNTGYENFVLEKYDLLSRAEKNRVKFLLLKSRAEGKLGKYRTALDTLATIEAMNCELSQIEKFHFESIENHCNWILGNISTEQFLAKLKILCESDLAKDSILDKFNFLHFSLKYGKKNKINTTDFYKKIAKLKKVGQKILSNDNFSQEMKVNIEFLILENEFDWLVLENTSLKGESVIYEAASVYISEHWDKKENFPLELKMWVDKSNDLISKVQNITTKADISYLQIKLWFHLEQSEQFWSINRGKSHVFKAEVAEYFVEKLYNIINIYTEYQQTYSVIRSKMLMVEMLSLIGKSEESETLRKEINNQSNKMSYDALKNLTEFSLHKSLFDYAQNNKPQKNN